jgi:protein-S-isoprenylcysteine O-methyltransferase Ste14
MSASILISQHWLVAMAGLIMSALFYGELVEQEKRLQVKFGDDYKRYMQKVPRINLLVGFIRLLKRRNE